MANIMSLKSLRNKTSRNGFDLSFKKNFTAKAGEHTYQIRYYPTDD
jgi:hypothetical protein